ncbi:MULTISPECIES: DUF4159 domain-containing protein [Pacificibacter]|uniref:DUF4159 domain-containing protein n=1 Tax=Pacificibacter TaxID=1042323 RepID=UPI001C08AC98|nr:MULTISPECIES: DUF4159 domain-containing protein [Pacificibacter]MBU2936596.1 DUF4159 domain-containing protein [Pacificibacter marinus]MDO6614601.1 DUF4159 domain-containing protein [Pacificibacter sp. 1_MG-2023]
MWIVGPIGFATPWLLWGLLVLPLLWLLLRAVPPAPKRLRFSGVALLLGLKDTDAQAAATPWWLMLLRMGAIAALILAFAGPVLNPKIEDADTGPMILMVDGTWADAPIWSAQIARIDDILEQAERNDRLVAFVVATDLPSGGLSFKPARDWRAALAGLQPAAHAPDAEELTQAIGALDRAANTTWLSSGADFDGRSEVLEALQGKGAVSVLELQRPIFALGPVNRTEQGVSSVVHRIGGLVKTDVTVAAIGPDPSGIERVLGQTSLSVEAGETVVSIALRTELRNRVTRFEIENIRSAGAVQLIADSLKRPEVALISGEDDGSNAQLLSHLHYLRAAFDPTSDVIEGAFSDVIAANPDVIVLADVARLAGGEAADLLEWTQKGGVLLRFSGPKLAASDVAREGVDPLLPVRLRAGGRSVGGAMTWGAPQGLRPFAETSPFYGLEIPSDVTVSSQVMAQPDPELAARVIATLADGTPLVTRKAIGQGQVVLFHVTANAQWSTLPLSGVFVSMLQRLTTVSHAQGAEANDLSGQTLTPVTVLNGFGELLDAGLQASVDGEVFAGSRASKATPAGVYQTQQRAVALNVFGRESVLEPAVWPNSVQMLGVQDASEVSLKPVLLMAALMALVLDLIATLVLSGRVTLGRAISAVGGLILGVSLAGTQSVQAQEDADRVLRLASSELTLAYVITGDEAIDRISQQGLQGLSQVLAYRTSVEPSAPMGVDLEVDPLGVFPILYWPMTEAQPPLSAASYAKLNAYMRAGGMIFFDTRDGDISAFGRETALGIKLRNIAYALDVPPLEPVPQDHVLTRTFYLLQGFPGRFDGADVWVQKSAAETAQIEGMPFRNLNDNVSPVIIGANDWASAWAVGDNGRALRPVGSGYTGEMQREMAYRFGVNLILYVLTGSYKSDQVHVPALLERLGE